MDLRENLSTNEMKIHANSKKEMYSLLRVQGGYYLPPIQQANTDFIMWYVERSRYSFNFYSVQ